VYLLLRRSGLWLAPMDFLPSLLSGISSSLFASDFFFFFFPFLRPLNPSCFFHMMVIDYFNCFI